MSKHIIEANSEKEIADVFTIGRCQNFEELKTALEHVGDITDSQGHVHTVENLKEEIDKLLAAKEIYDGIIKKEVELTNFPRYANLREKISSLLIDLVLKNSPK